MKTYLLVIPDDQEKAWEEFKEEYKKEGLGKNIGQAILKMIEQKVKVKR